MLNRTTVSTPLLRVRWRGMRDAVLVGPQAMLFQVVGLVLVICLLMCAYLWQSNAISDIVDDSSVTLNKSLRLERENADLMLMLARIEHPAVVERQARGQGMEPAAAAFVIQMPTAPAQRRAADAPLVDFVALWHEATERLSTPGVLLGAAFWAR